MKLTGKCKEDFIKYMIPEMRKMDGVGPRFFDDTIIKQFENLPDCFKNAMIIEFFDFSGLLTNQISYGKNNYWKPVCVNFTSGLFYKTRKEATDISIKWANQYYNDKL